MSVPSAILYFQLCLWIAPDTLMSSIKNHNIKNHNIENHNIENHNIENHNIENHNQGGKSMYARVVTSRLQESKKDEWIAIARDSIVPALRQQKGFQGFVMLANTEKDSCIAYSMWETEADLKASETSGFYQEQVAKLKNVLALPPVREMYELTVLPATETERVRS